MKIGCVIYTSPNWKQVQALASVTKIDYYKPKDGSSMDTVNVYESVMIFHLGHPHMSKSQNDIQLCVYCCGSSQKGNMFDHILD